MTKDSCISTRFFIICKNKQFHNFCLMGKNVLVPICIAVTILVTMAALFIVNGYFESKTPPAAASEPQIQIQIRADTLPAWQTAYMLNEIKDYRRFIEKERQEYQHFLTRTYSTVGILITALAAILTFLGIQSLKDLKTKAEKKLTQAKKEIQEKVEAHYQKELSKTIKEKLEEDQALVEALQILARKQAVWYKAKILVTGSKEVLAKMEKNEMPFFEKRDAEVEFEVLPIREGIDFSAYSAIIHTYSKNQETDSDKGLIEQLFPKIKEKAIPLIVYDHYQGGKVDEKTFKEISNYFHGSIANFPFSLIANTYDAITLHAPEKK